MKMILNLTDEEVRRVTACLRTQVAIGAATGHAATGLWEGTLAAVENGVIEQTLDEFRSAAVLEENADLEIRPPKPPGRDVVWDPALREWTTPEPEGNAGWDYEKDG